MRILHIMAGRGNGGAETYSTDIMLSLHAQGIDQCCVVGNDAPRTQEMMDAGVRVAPEVLTVPFRPWQRFQLQRLIDAEKPDLIHCWMRRAASLVPVWAEGPTIGWFGGYYDPANFKKCDQFVGVTQGIVDHQVEKGVPFERAHYIPTFPDVKDEVAASRAALNTPDDAPVVLALSRLHQKKGLDTLLYATAKLPGVYVWLAGDGPLEGDLKALTKKLEMEDRVRFLGWRTDRGALLRASTVCALPSRYEPFGTVTLEAWAAQTPYVAAMSAGPAATVDDGVNGLLVPIDDVDALSNALNRALTDKALSQKMVQNGYRTYKEKYTREVVTQQMISFYQEMIQQYKQVKAV